MVGLLGDLPVVECFILEDETGSLRAAPGGFIQEVEDRDGGVVEVGRNTRIVTR